MRFPRSVPIKFASKPNRFPFPSKACQSNAACSCVPTTSRFVPLLLFAMCVHNLLPNGPHKSQSWLHFPMPIQKTHPPVQTQPTKERLSLAWRGESRRFTRMKWPFWCWNALKKCIQPEVWKKSTFSVFSICRCPVQQKLSKKSQFSIPPNTKLQLRNPPHLCYWWNCAPRVQFCALGPSSRPPMVLDSNFAAATPLESGNFGFSLQPQGRLHWRGKMPK